MTAIAAVTKDADGLPTLSVRSGTFKLRADGILVGLPTSLDVELADAKEMVEAMRKIHPKGNGRLLLDQRKVQRRLSPEARAYLAEHSDQFERIAILVQSAISRFLASGILMMTAQRKKVRVFDSEALAVAWLKDSTS